MTHRAILMGTALIAAAPAMAQDGPVVETTAGPVMGLSSQYDPEVEVFLGIPYGGDTGGENRFRAPTPVEPWTETRMATALGPACAGPGFPPEPYAQEEGDDLDKTPIGEDCLVLNVWTPATGDGGNRPVMVWHHGGGFNAGSGGSVRYDGTALAANQDVVLVTTNHRLNIFGYTNLAEMDPSRAADANAGMQDIVQSLEWVRDNIAAFGGDPSNVTVFGESGGGGKVTALMTMPSAEGLFHRVIAQSGTAITVAPAEERAAQAAERMAAMGIAPDLSNIGDLSMDLIMENFGGSGPWVDGTILPGQPWETAAPEVSADVPLMLGWNVTEETFFAGPRVVEDEAGLLALLAEEAGIEGERATSLVALYREAHPEADDNELYFRIQSDADRGADAIHIAEMRAAQEGAAPVFVYRFEGMTEVRDLMSPHTLEIAYVFDNLALSTRMNGEVTDEKQALADIMSEAWATFARDGVPAAQGLPEWTPFTAESRSIMILGPEPELTTLPTTVEAAISG